MIEIRRALASDAEAIAALSSEVQADHADVLPQLFKRPAPDSFPPRVVRELLEEPDRIFLVASIGGAVVGYASAQMQQRDETLFRHPRSALFIHWIGVHDLSRRRGVGRALVNALREAAATLEATSLLLEVWAFNTKAQAFYKAVGFRPERHILSLDLDAPAG